MRIITGHQRVRRFRGIGCIGVLAAELRDPFSHSYSEVSDPRPRLAKLLVADPMLASSAQPPWRALGPHGGHHHPAGG